MSCVDQTMMLSQEKIVHPEICKNALVHFSDEKNKNIKTSAIKKHNIVIEPREILQNLCFIQGKTNNILMDYRYFKCCKRWKDFSLENARESTLRAKCC